MGEYGFADSDTSEANPVIYVREEPPRLLWRSIVQGFGLSLGFFLASIVGWLLAVIVLFFVLRQGLPSLPSF